MLNLWAGSVEALDQEVGLETAMSSLNVVQANIAERGSVSYIYQSLVMK